jgi:hypothetical protein
MSPESSSSASAATPASASASASASAPIVLRHWTPEQALAVFECLQALRQALWSEYGPQVQQAWREQLVPDGTPPEFDPDEPF